MLLYKDGNFMQLLEGEEATVRELYTIIIDDQRHCNVTTISEETTPERLFPSWSMGFQNLRMVDPAKFPAYSDFLDTPLTRFFRGSVARTGAAVAVQENQLSVSSN